MLGLDLRGISINQELSAPPNRRVFSLPSCPLSKTHQRLKGTVIFESKEENKSVQDVLITHLWHKTNVHIVAWW